MAATLGPITVLTATYIDTFDTNGNTIQLSDFVTAAGGVPKHVAVSNHSAELAYFLVGDADFISNVNVYQALFPGETALVRLNPLQYTANSLPNLAVAASATTVTVSAVGVDVATQ